MDKKVRSEIRKSILDYVSFRGMNTKTMRVFYDKEFTDIGIEFPGTFRVYLDGNCPEHFIEGVNAIGNSLRKKYEKEVPNSFDIECFFRG